MLKITTCERWPSPLCQLPGKLGSGRYVSLSPLWDCEQRGQKEHRSLLPTPQIQGPCSGGGNQCLIFPAAIPCPAWLNQPPSPV